MLPRKAHYDPSTDPAASIAKAEAENNSHGAKTGFKNRAIQYERCVTSLTAALESGVNEDVVADFPGATVRVRGAKRGENPVIPVEEGGEINKSTGHQTKANEFEGRGGPEDKIPAAENDRRGDDDVTGTTRQKQL